MEEVRKEEVKVEEPKTINNTLATLALIVAVGALVLAWISYDQQTIEDTKETVRIEKDALDEKMEDAAVQTGTAAREATGAVIEKTGEALEVTGQATQEAGADIKKDDGAMPR